MNAFRVTAVFGRGNGFKKMMQASAQHGCERFIKGYRRVEAKFSRTPRGGWRIVRKIKAARRFAADRWPQRSVLGEPKRQLVDRTRAAALELELDFAHRRRSVTCLENTLVERDLDRPGWQIDDAGMPMDIGGENRFKPLALQIRAEVGRDEGDREREIGHHRRDPRLPLAAPQRIVVQVMLHGRDEGAAALAIPQRQSV